ncbi:MAG: hypothetical protein ACRYHQ_09285 [Janthinobacterium lividum]
MSALPPDMISIREFARRDGCSEKRVRNAIQTRHLPTCPGKLLPPNLVGTGWREGNRRGADTVRTVRTKVSALPKVSAPEPDPLPSEACSLSAIVAGGAQDLAVLLLRLGLARAAVAEHADQWLAQQRAGAVDCMAEDVPPPAEHNTWASHPLFLGPWLEGTSWHELEALAAHAPDR